MNFDPRSDQLLKRSELPKIEGAPDGAAWFWGKEDQVRQSISVFHDPNSFHILQHGRLNLLTSDRILKAKEEVKLGHIITLK